MMAELPLALPPADATRIKRLAGTLEFLVSTGTEEVDLEFPSFEKGVKGHYLDAEIKEVAEEGKKIKIKLAKPAKQIEAIQFVDPDGAPIEGDRRGYFASRSVTTMEFELPRKLPPGSKILAVVHTDVKTYTTDWESPVLFS